MCSKIEQEWETWVIHSDNHSTVESAKMKYFNWQLWVIFAIITNLERSMLKNLHRISALLKHFKTWVLEKAVKTPNTHSERERVIKHFSIDLQHQSEHFRSPRSSFSSSHMLCRYGWFVRVSSHWRAFKNGTRKKKNLTPNKELVCVFNRQTAIVLQIEKGKMPEGAVFESPDRRAEF